VQKKKLRRQGKPLPQGKGNTTLVLSTVKLLHHEKKRINQWGSRGLQAWPETGSLSRPIVGSDESWLTVESFFMSCSISWMASLIDNLYLLDLIVSVIN
jgi:hypothetical protein